jgi:hypothetical protein
LRESESSKSPGATEKAGASCVWSERVSKSGAAGVAWAAPVLATVAAKILMRESLGRRMRLAPWGRSKAWVKR